MARREVTGVQLAELLGLSPRYTHKLVLGTEHPSRERVLQVAAALELDSASLLKKAGYDGA